MRNRQGGTSAGRAGLRVLGVEPDDAMAAVARDHGVRVELARFETWDPAGRTFDLVTAGHACHWVDPIFGLAKVASVPEPRGTVALFWNYHAVDGFLAEAFDGVYAVCAPELEVLGSGPDGVSGRGPFLGKRPVQCGGKAPTGGGVNSARMIGPRCWRRSATTCGSAGPASRASTHAARGHHRARWHGSGCVRHLCLVIATHLGMTASSGARSVGCVPATS